MLLNKIKQAVVTAAIGCCIMISGVQGAEEWVKLYYQNDIDDLGEKQEAVYDALELFIDGQPIILKNMRAGKNLIKKLTLDERVEVEVFYQGKEIFKEKFGEPCDVSMHVPYWDKNSVIKTVYGPGKVNILLMCVDEIAMCQKRGFNPKEWIMSMEVSLSMF